MFKRSALSVLLLLTFVSSALAQLSQQEQKDLADYIKQNYTKCEVMIPMRDGVKLFCASMSRRTNRRSIRSCSIARLTASDPTAPDNFKTTLGPDDLFAREGYIFVYRDVRGRYMSEGVYEDVRPYIPTRKPTADRRNDRHLRHGRLADQERAEQQRPGRHLRAFRIRAFTLEPAIDSHPALKAFSPQAPVCDWFHGDDIHHNGALFPGSEFLVLHRLSAASDSDHRTDYVKAVQRTERRTATSFISMRRAERIVGELRKAVRLSPSSSGTR